MLDNTGKFGIKLAVYLKLCVESRLAWLLVSLHASWFFLAVANMSPPSRDFARFLESVSGSTTILFAGRLFHFAYESLLMRLLFLADLPALLVGVPISLGLSPLLKALHFGIYSGSYVGAGLMLLLGSCQWLLVGARIELKLSDTANGKN